MVAEDKPLVDDNGDHQDALEPRRYHPVVQTVMMRAAKEQKWARALLSLTCRLFNGGSAVIQDSPLRQAQSLGGISSSSDPGLPSSSLQHQDSNPRHRGMRSEQQQQRPGMDRAVAHEGSSSFAAPAADSYEGVAAIDFFSQQREAVAVSEIEAASSLPGQSFSRASGPRSLIAATTSNSFGHDDCNAPDILSRSQTMPSPFAMDNYAQGSLPGAHRPNADSSVKPAPQHTSSDQAVRLSARPRGHNSDGSWLTGTTTTGQTSSVWQAPGGDRGGSIAFGQIQNPPGDQAVPFIDAEATSGLEADMPPAVKSGGGPHFQRPLFSSATAVVEIQKRPLAPHSAPVGTRQLSAPDFAETPDPPREARGFISGMFSMVLGGCLLVAAVERRGLRGHASSPAAVDTSRAGRVTKFVPLEPIVSPIGSTCWEEDHSNSVRHRGTRSHLTTGSSANFKSFSLRGSSSKSPRNSSKSRWGTVSELLTGIRLRRQEQAQSATVLSKLKADAVLSVACGDNARVLSRQAMAYDGNNGGRSECEPIDSKPQYQKMLAISMPPGRVCDPLSPTPLRTAASLCCRLADPQPAAARLGLQSLDFLRKRSLQSDVSGHGPSLTNVMKTLQHNGRSGLVTEPARLLEGEVHPQGETSGGLLGLLADLKKSKRQVTELGRRESYLSMQALGSEGRLCRMPSYAWGEGSGGGQ